MNDKNNTLLYELLDEYLEMVGNPDALRSDVRIAKSAIVLSLLELYLHLQSDTMCDENQVVDLLMKHFGLERSGEE